jgi:hypothetical protein
MKKVIATLVALVSSCALLTGNPAPAQAGQLCEVGHICGDFFHYAPDDGFDDPIPVTCDLNVGFGNYQAVAEGKAATCHDADGYWVGPGRTVSCLAADGKWVKETEHGWHKLTDNQNLRCVHGLQ